MNAGSAILVPVAQNPALAWAGIDDMDMPAGAMDVAMDEAGAGIFPEKGIDRSRIDIHDLCRLFRFFHFALPSQFADGGFARIQRLREKISLPGFIAHALPERLVFDICRAERIAVNKQRGFPEYVEKPGIGNMTGTCGFEKLRPHQKIPVAVHNQERNARVGEFPQTRDHLQVEGIGKVVVPGPRIEQIAEYVKRRS